MVLYECKACNFSSIIKSHYNRHLTTNKHMCNIEQMTPKINNQEKVYTKYTQSIHKVYTNDTKAYINCEYCDKIFTSKQSMYRHKRLYFLIPF